MFITDENNAFTKKWPSLEAKFGKMKKSNFYRIDSWFSEFRSNVNEFTRALRGDGQKILIVSW